MLIRGNIIGTKKKEGKRDVGPEVHKPERVAEHRDSAAQQDALVAARGHVRSAAESTGPTAQHLSKCEPGAASVLLAAAAHDARERQTTAAAATVPADEW